MSSADPTPPRHPRLAAAEPLRVRAPCTARQLTQASLAANRRLCAVVVLALLLGAFQLVFGRVGLAVPMLLVGLLLGYQLLVAPRKALERGAGQVDWTLDTTGLRVRTAVTDVQVAWSQVQHLTCRPAVLLFRVRPTMLVLPRRCLQPGDAERIAALVATAGVAVTGSPVGS